MNSILWTGIIDDNEEVGTKSVPMPFHSFSFLTKGEMINKSVQISSSFKKEPVLTESISSYSSLKLQPELLAFEIWKGSVVQIEDDSFVIDVRNEKIRTVRRVLRVKKKIIEGDVNHAFKGLGVRVLYKKLRIIEFLGNKAKESIKKTTRVILSQPSQIPLEVRDWEFEEKMKRYSYMFENGKH